MDRRRFFIKLTHWRPAPLATEIIEGDGRPRTAIAYADTGQRLIATLGKAKPIEPR